VPACLPACLPACVPAFPPPLQHSQPRRQSGQRHGL